MKEQIRSFIVKSTGNKNVRDEDDFFQNGYANSLLAMQIVSYIETEFDIIVENGEMQLENFNSIDNIANYVNGKQSNES